MTDTPSADDPIVTARAWISDIAVETVRTDAIQAFLKQETIFVELTTATGVQGLGYSYTIGMGGASVLALLESTLLPQLLGQDVHRPEAVWQSGLAAIRSTTGGVIAALALAAVDTAVWDARSRSTGVPLWKLAGGAGRSIPVYDTEGGWLHLSEEELVAQALASRARGLSGVKIKVGRPDPHEDLDRLRAVREAVGPAFDIMLDANQSFTVAQALRRARLFEEVDLYWFEEPLPADDVSGHAALSQRSTIPVAVGESLYSIGRFRDYLERGAASIVQVDVARIGGITPWLKVAHLAEAFGVDVAPHFLMELHLPLVAAIPNGLYLEHIPQLRTLMREEVHIVDGRAEASDAPGLGIAWDIDAIRRARVS